jgi:hypothetical protein
MPLTRKKLYHTNKTTVSRQRQKQPHTDYDEQHAIPSARGGAPPFTNSECVVCRICGVQKPTENGRCTTGAPLDEYMCTHCNMYPIFIKSSVIKRVKDDENEDGDGGGVDNEVHRRVVSGDTCGESRCIHSGETKDIQIQESLCGNPPASELFCLHCKLHPCKKMDSIMLPETYKSKTVLLYFCSKECYCADKTDQTDQTHKCTSVKTVTGSSNPRTKILTQLSERKKNNTNSGQFIYTFLAKPDHAETTPWTTEQQSTFLTEGAIKSAIEEGKAAMAATVVQRLHREQMARRAQMPQ